MRQRILLSFAAALVSVRLLACGNDYVLDTPDAGGDAGTPGPGADGSITDATGIGTLPLDASGDDDAGIDSAAGPDCTSCDSHHCINDGGCEPLVFVTETKTTGALDDAGVAGGNAICQNEARLGLLNGDYVAWLSTQDMDAISRVMAGVGGNRKVWGADGTPIALSYPAMIGNNLLAPIASTAQGGPIPAGESAWTGTTQAGGSASSTCNGWMSGANGDNGVTGIPSTTSSSWINAFFTQCSSANHLYCFEIVH